MAKEFSDFQHEVNAVRGKVSRKGVGFKITYPKGKHAESIEGDMATLRAMDYEPVVQGKNGQALFVPLYLSKYPA